MWYSILADVVVAFHLAYVSYVLIGQALILLGWALGWGWVRNLWFRVTHLAAILVVAIESVFGITCPLTNWEYELNKLAQRDVEARSFIGQWMNDVLFYDIPDDDWRFLAAYLGFAALVLFTFVLVPPRVAGYRKSTVAAIVLGLVGAMFMLFISPIYIGLGITGAGLLCWALGARAARNSELEAVATDPASIARRAHP